MVKLPYCENMAEYQRRPDGRWERDHFGVRCIASAEYCAGRHIPAENWTNFRDTSYWCADCAARFGLIW